MKDIKILVGQKWQHKDYNNCYMIIVSVGISNIEVAQHHSRDRTNSVYSISHFRHLYKFVPQTDLEWLAVNVEKWNEGTFLQKKAKLAGGYGWFLNNRFGAYTKKQWQQKRIKLGVYKDNNVMEKPVINLRGAKVGDEFIDGRGLVQKAELINDIQIVTSAKYEDGNTYYTIFDKENGEGEDRDDGNYLVSKVDPNAWWKDLPPAGCFELYGTRFIAQNLGGQWWGYKDEPHLDPDDSNKIYWCCGESRSALNLDVSVDDWESSKVKISDLKKWQEQNK